MRIDAHSRDEKTEVNLTPMIDVVFLLIIFFMVATKFADIERPININPPTAKNVKAMAEPPKNLIVNVSQKGTYSVLSAGNRNQEYRLDDLDALIEKATETNDDQSVEVRGDANTFLKHVTKVLDLCEKHGVKHKRLTTAAQEG